MGYVDDTLNHTFGLSDQHCNNALVHWIENGDDRKTPPVEVAGSDYRDVMAKPLDAASRVKGGAKSGIQEPSPHT
jgi:hypothetical protein